MPDQPHDSLTFDELQNVYSFRKTSDRRQLFTKLVIDELKNRQQPTVLDIGCGSGMGVGPKKQGFVQRIKEHSGHLVGLEPDGSATDEDLFDELHVSLFEDAQLEPNSIDVCFSHFVMEHVEDPQRFLSKLHEVLSPGGVYLFITPNAASYFVKITSLLNWLKLDEGLLRWLKPESEVDDYHYPVFYRCNRDSEIAKMASQHGFQAEFGFYERNGSPGYFPGPLRPVLWGLNFKRKMIHNRKCLLNLVCRLQKN